MRKAAPVVFTPVDVCHAEAFHAAWDEVARERRFLSVQAAPPLDEVHEFIRTNLAAGNPHLLAISGEQIVGWCDIIRGTRAPTQHRGALSLALRASHRGRGLGAALLEQTLQLGWAAGFKRIELIVRGDNLPALALYRKAGFVQEGLRRKAFLIDKLYYDLIDMAILHPDLEASETAS